MITEILFYFLKKGKWTEDGWNITRVDPSVFSSVGASLTKNWVHERKVNRKMWIDFVLILNIHVWVSLRRNNFSWFGCNLNTSSNWASRLESKAPSTLGRRALCSYLDTVCFQTFLNFLITQYSREMTGTICKRASLDYSDALFFLCCYYSVVKVTSVAPPYHPLQFRQKITSTFHLCRSPCLS